MRFYANNVKLSIADGQTIRNHQSRPTDEGYEYNATEYTLEGNKLFATVHHGGQDCDGRTGGCAELMATVAFPCAIPNWESMERSAYDQYAELDNY
jgi:hypothetical protein